LQLHPDSLVEWLNHAAAVLHTPAIVQAGERIQWSRELRAPRDSGHLALGRTVKQGKLQKACWLAIADKKYGWSVEISSREADSLLALLFAAGTQSRLTDSVAPSTHDSVEVPVRIRSQPNPGFRAGVYGRVFARYVVDTAGQVEPGSLVIVLASDPMLAELARKVLRGSRFYPALSRGRPVRQLVEQAMIWHPE
ncbi:MAG TPA: energy transducer TonB, partial [Gemmatimonadales bacterium]|nr:energy transducer TonB [Gemmatimonadales bacterium]